MGELASLEIQSLHIPTVHKNNYPYLFLFSQEAEAEPEEAEPTEFTIKLTKFDAASKVKLIKEIKNLIPGLNLVQVCLHSFDSQSINFVLILRLSQSRSLLVEWLRTFKQGV